MLGVAIGVAAVAAIERANASVTESFRDAASSLAGRSEFVVTGVAGVPVEALERIAFLWKFGSFAPAVTGWAVVDDGSGELAEILGVDVGGDASVREVTLVSDPRRAMLRLAAGDAVLVPEDFAARHRLEVGGSIAVLAGGKRARVAVAGLLALTGVAKASGGDLLLTDVFTAQRLLGRPGRLDRVDVVLDPGADRREVERRLLESLPPGLAIEPPTRSAATADRMVRAFRFNLNALGSLTLLVGMFLVANAVSTSVLRRRPEIAALRSIGASRGMLFGIFMAEGLAVGAAGTALGELGGVLLSKAALSTVSRTVESVYLPTAKIAAAGYGRAAALAAAVGMLACLGATALPAAEATRVEPAPALTTGSVEIIRRRRLGGRIAGALLCLAAAAGAARAPGVRGFPVFGFAAVALVVGALAFASPLAVRAAARASARPLARLFGEPGRLGSRFFGGSLARNGIAVTALAMALGMTLAMIVTVASIRETVRVWVEETLRSDLWVKSPAGKLSGVVGDLPEEVVGFLRGIPGVAAVDPFRARDLVDEAGRPWTLASGDFSVLARIGGLPMVDRENPRDAAAEARRRGEAMISEPYARRFGVGPGDSLSIPTPLGRRRVRVAGVYRDYSNDKGTVVLDRELYLALFGDRRVTSVAVLASPGVEASDLRRRVLASAKDRFALSISTNRELRASALRIFDRTFAVTGALEAIAVAVAVLGIANALVASAIERRRAFGLLRAVGASAGEIRRAVLVEAGLTGATAALLALPAAAAFAYLLLDVINPQSFGWTVSTSIPPGRLAVAVGLVLAAAGAAGIYPGRLAAAVDPAAALAEE